MSNTIRKKLILHCGYPKAGSSSIIYNISNVTKDCNVLNINEDQLLFDCFEKIRSLNQLKYNFNLRTIENTLSNYLDKKINFFCYERAFNISHNIEKKFEFLKRLKELANSLDFELKICIFIRHQPSILISYYKEEFFRLIFINFKFLKFKNFTSHILENKNNFSQNLNYFYNLSEIIKIFNHRDVYFGTLEDFKRNQDNELINLINFSSINKFDLNKKIIIPINSSDNRKLINLLFTRLKSYLTYKKNIHSRIIKNFFIIILRIVIVDRILNKYVKLDKSEQKKLENHFSLSNHKCEKFFRKSKYFYESYLT